jgi:hypothetical protein
MSCEDAVFALESFRHRLAEGAYLPFVETVSKGLADCPVALLPGLIESRLQENPRFLKPEKPKHEPGSVEAIAAEVRTHDRGGLFGVFTGGPLAPMPPVANQFPTLGEQLSPSTDLSVAQRMELLARNKISGNEVLDTRGFFRPTAAHAEYQLPTGQAVASRQGSMFGRQDPVK